jgi:hypothetical protein
MIILGGGICPISFCDAVGFSIPQELVDALSSVSPGLKREVNITGVSGVRSN